MFSHQVCLKTPSRCHSTSGRLSTDPVSKAAFGICTLIMNCRILHVLRWSPGWSRGARPVRSSAACMDCASRIPLSGPCAAVSRAGVGHTVIKSFLQLLSTLARKTSKYSIVHGTCFIPYLLFCVILPAAWKQQNKQKCRFSC